MKSLLEKYENHIQPMTTQWIDSCVRSAFRYIPKQASFWLAQHSPIILKQEIKEKIEIGGRQWSSSSQKVQRINWTSVHKLSLLSINMFIILRYYNIRTCCRWTIYFLNWRNKLKNAVLNVASKLWNRCFHISNRSVALRRNITIWIECILNCKSELMAC